MRISERSNLVKKRTKKPWKIIKVVCGNCPLRTQHLEHWKPSGPISLSHSRGSKWSWNLPAHPAYLLASLHCSGSLANPQSSSQCRIRGLRWLPVGSGNPFHKDLWVFFCQEMINFFLNETHPFMNLWWVATPLERLCQVLLLLRKM